MNLLPKSKQQFAEKGYWNTFFKSRGSKEFEWYGEYPELCGILHKYIKTKDLILVVGCGNSRLSADLYDVGHRQITNIDISSVVIRQMQNGVGKERPEMIFQQMDALEMTFTDEQFSVVLDKGTLDALMPDDEEVDIQRIKKLFSEISRVLKFGGRYIIISLLQEHILKTILDYFMYEGWLIRICRCFDVEAKSFEETGSVGMPIFLVVCTKFKKMESFKPVLELNIHDSDKVVRVSSSEEMMKSVKGAQHAAVVCSRVNKQDLDEELYLELSHDDYDTRYSVYIADDASKLVKKFAAFLVPQGRETEWLFSTKEGRKYLQKQSGYDRLAVVLLHRGQMYGDMKEIQDELRQSILQLAPSRVITNTGSPQIPYLTLGDGLGRRTTIFKGSSEFSGDFVVEEVEVEGETFRRLIFLNNQSTVQSEAKIQLVKSKKKTSKRVDVNSLVSTYHMYMALSVSLLKSGQNAKVLIIGLGGGGLCTFLHNIFPNLEMTAIELDPAIVKVSQEYFGFKLNEKMKVIVEDGVEYLRKEAKAHAYDLVILDADSKDKGTALSSPPQCFVQEEILQCINNMLGSHGIFVLNLVSRMPQVKEEVKNTIHKYFSLVSSYCLEQEVNEILFATNGSMNKQSFKEHMENSGTLLNDVMRCKLKSDSFVDLQHFMSELKITDSPR